MKPDNAYTPTLFEVTPEHRPSDTDALADHEPLRCPYCGESAGSEYLMQLNHWPMPRPYGNGIGKVCITQELLLNHLKSAIRDRRQPDPNETKRLMRQGFDVRRITSRLIAERPPQPRIGSIPDPRQGAHQ